MIKRQTRQASSASCSKTSTLRASSATQNQTDHTRIRAIGWTCISILLTIYILTLHHLKRGHP
jgi:hypothetical protein